MECRTPGGVCTVNMRDKMVRDARRGYDAPVKNTGPFLDTSGKRERIVIPYPKKSGKLLARMKSYEFTFILHSASWVRFTDRKWRGKLWSSSRWLELAQKCHAEAYGVKEPVKSTVKPLPKKRGILGRQLCREEDGTIRESITPYQAKLFTEA